MGLTNHLTADERRRRIATILLRAAFLLARKKGWIVKREFSPSFSPEQEGISHKITT